VNYVSPDARFRGVSAALLAALEDRAKEESNERCELKSSETARRFYLERGYPLDADGNFYTTSGYPKSKVLLDQKS
jgi:GNAT superfamily N-acetyltransferase